MPLISCLLDRPLSSLGSMLSSHAPKTREHLVLGACIAQAALSCARTPYGSEERKLSLGSQSMKLPQISALPVLTVAMSQLCPGAVAFPWLMQKSLDAISILWSDAVYLVTAQILLRLDLLLHQPHHWVIRREYMVCIEAYVSLFHSHVYYNMGTCTDDVDSHTQPCFAQSYTLCC